MFSTRESVPYREAVRSAGAPSVRDSVSEESELSAVTFSYSANREECHAPEEAKGIASGRAVEGKEANLLSSPAVVTTSRIALAALTPFLLGVDLVQEVAGAETLSWLSKYTGNFSLGVALVGLGSLFYLGKALTALEGAPIVGRLAGFYKKFGAEALTLATCAAIVVGESVFPALFGGWADLRDIPAGIAGALLTYLSIGKPLKERSAAH